MKSEKRRLTSKQPAKLLGVILSVLMLITSASVSPPAAEAGGWFNNLCGGIFTILTAPIWVFCQDNPTFRKNNPFRKKQWEEEIEFYQPEEPKDEYKLTPHYYRKPENTQPEGEETKENERLKVLSEFFTKLIQRLEEKNETLIQDLANLHKKVSKLEKEKKPSVDIEDLISRVVAKLPPQPQPVDIEDLIARVIAKLPFQKEIEDLKATISKLIEENKEQRKQAEEKRKEKVKNKFSKYRTKAEKQGMKVSSDSAKNVLAYFDKRKREKIEKLKRNNPTYSILDIEEDCLEIIPKIIERIKASVQVELARKEIESKVGEFSENKRQIILGKFDRKRKELKTARAFAPILREFMAELNADINLIISTEKAEKARRAAENAAQIEVLKSQIIWLQNQAAANREPVFSEEKRVHDLNVKYGNITETNQTASPIPMSSPRPSPTLSDKFNDIGRVNKTKYRR